MRTHTYAYTFTSHNEHLANAIKNNLTTSDAGYVLDARQGKALGDKLIKILRTQITTGSTGWASVAFGVNCIPLGGVAEDQNAGIESIGYNTNLKSYRVRIMNIHNGEGLSDWTGYVRLAYITYTA